MTMTLPLRALLSIAALTTVLAGCATPGPAVRSDYDHTINFSNLHTFGFPAQTGTDRGGYATLITSHFKAAIQREMSVRGYVYAETNPDMIVNFYSEARDKTQVYPNPTGYMSFRYGRPRYGWYSAWPFYEPDVDVVSYKSGTLKIDVVDPKRQQTIWEASAEERLSEQAQDNPQPNIERLVTAMFAKFPRGAANP